MAKIKVSITSGFKDVYQWGHSEMTDGSLNWCNYFKV